MTTPASDQSLAPAVKRRAPGGGISPVAHTARLHHGACARCGKNRYPDRSTARKAARIVSPGRRLRVYRCGGYWHLTSSRGRGQELDQHGERR